MIIFLLPIVKVLCLSVDVIPGKSEHMIFDWISFKPNHVVVGLISWDSQHEVILLTPGEPHKLATLLRTTSKSQQVIVGLLLGKYRKGNIKVSKMDQVFSLLILK